MYCFQTWFQIDFSVTFYLFFVFQMHSEFGFCNLRVRNLLALGEEVRFYHIVRLINHYTRRRGGVS